MVTFEDKFEDGSQYTKFSTFDSEPSEARIRRSQAALKTWEDPEWRAKWYKKRWGDKHQSQDKEEVAFQKGLEKRVRAIPPDLLGSPELAAMTEDEIEDAIREYMTSQSKRNKSRTKTRSKQKAALISHLSSNTTRLSRDALLNQDKNAMLQAKKRRSEQAKRAYQTRLLNNPDREEASVKSVRVLPVGSTAQDALLRIEASLDQKEVPKLTDVELIMKPAKLGKRKDLLRRILRECYNLRGRCIPTDLNNPEANLVFATQCKLSDLGSFVMYLMSSKR